MTQRTRSILNALARKTIPVRWRRALYDKRRTPGPRQQNGSLRLPVPSLDKTSCPDLIIFGGEDSTRGLPVVPSKEWIGNERRLFRFPKAAALNFAKCQAFIQEQAIVEAVCIVQHPSWKPIALDLRNRYGWKLIIDSSAFETDKSPMDVSQDQAWQRLISTGDLNITRRDTIDQNWNTLPWSKINSLYGLVSIIIVSYNGLSLIQQCILSILQRTIYPNYRIIIVDNNSTPDVKAYLNKLQEEERRVRVCFNDTNKGFSAANNIGLQQAKDSEFLVLLNNDTVVSRGWLCRLLRYARRPEIGLVGPVTNWTGNEARIPVDYRDISQMEKFAAAWALRNEGKFFDIRVAAMFCVTMRKSVVDQVGLLDERFGTGMFEDEDYARRVRQAGYRVICAEDAFVHHEGMASFSKLKDTEYRDLFERNKRLFEEKWGEPWVPHRARE